MRFLGIVTVGIVYTSPEIQNRGTSGPKIGHVNVSDKKTLKKTKKQKKKQLA